MHNSTTGRAVRLSLMSLCVSGIRKKIQCPSLASRICTHVHVCVCGLCGLASVRPVLSGVMIRLFCIRLVVHTSAVMREPVK